MQEKTAFSIYDASAGSGKTYTLVKEYLKIILLSNKNDAYRNILAITFTNKAVHEMKSRVVNSLSEFTKDKPTEKAQQLLENIHQETNLSVETIKDKAKSIIKHLIHNYAAFDISTIDKFTHKVIRAFAHDLNLPITFEVSLDTENLLTEAVDSIIAEAGNDEVLTKLLVDFTMEKTDDDKSWDVSRDIMDTGRLVLNENNREELKHFNDKSIADFVKIKSKLETLCIDFEKKCSDFANQVLDLMDKNGIDLKSFSRGSFPNHLNYIKENNPKANEKKYLEFDDIAINKTAKDKSIIEGLIPEFLAILKQVYAIFEEKNFYQAFLKNITPLSLLNTVSNELAKIQKDQNILSISEFNKLINEQIQNQPAPFIYERLGERYRHFFIDEFQDTSEMQWQNLIPLIDNATSSQDLDGVNGSLLIVGDPKQSIYRWRGGKAEQFIELGKDKNPFNNPEKKTFSLDTNYRSYSQVIEFNNDFFGMLANEFSNPDYKDLYENHSRQKINSQKGGCVSISFIPEPVSLVQDENESLDKNGLYLLATLNKIQEIKKKKFQNKEIVILTRKKSHGTAIANYLTENGIPILSSESLLLGSSSDVKCVVHVLNYLKNEKNSEAKANFLYYIAKNHQNKLAIHDFIFQGKELLIETEFQTWLSQFNIDFSFANLRKKSLYEVVEIIVSKIIYPKNATRIVPHQEYGGAYIQFFLDLVLEHDLKKQTSISDFLTIWETKSESLSIPSPEGNDAVRIMTIHKSKGLEFPVVIFPYAEEDYNRGPQEKIWLSANEESIGIGRALVNKNKSVEGFGQDALTIFTQKKQEDLLDDINVLYVALTRAEEQLHIISSFKIKSNGDLPNNMSSFFIKFLQNQHLFNETQLNYEFGNFERVSKIINNITNTKVIEQLDATLEFKNIKIAQRESVMWGTNRQKSIEYGIILHEILSYIKTKNDVDLAISKAIENGLIVFSQKKEVEETILSIVNHPELIDFYSDNVKILNEKTIIQKEGSIVKPDRMVINTNKEVFLLDYKTGLHQPRHQHQLEEYQSAIEKMGFKVIKKSVIYIGEEINVVNLSH